MAAVANAALARNEERLMPSPTGAVPAGVESRDMPIEPHLNRLADEHKEEHNDLGNEQQRHSGAHNNEENPVISLHTE
jgi:hypothetical protein